jgi:hypothetical protein
MPTVKIFLVMKRKSGGIESKIFPSGVSTELKQGGYKPSLRRSNFLLPNGLKCGLFDQDAFELSSEVQLRYQLWNDLNEKETYDKILPRCVISLWRYMNPVQCLAAALFKMQPSQANHVKPLLERLRAGKSSYKR